ncbi:hypothetical protein HMF7854_03915 [Sphingomonas ginkgonis]|uniref:Hpr(Ser) kinase/phosphatase n=1 Tax=Sphingomonas ginkgonis TaxID=2315330 RepID=A0A3R9WP57_9SPHN|nr:hypothetical protein [Sphingomonas ginkgonis]RST30067.1 hypothetical protein HMF7854_03915 [Sphingomonas ginkgonis]
MGEAVIRTHADEGTGDVLYGKGSAPPVIGWVDDHCLVFSEAHQAVFEVQRANVRTVEPAAERLTEALRQFAPARAQDPRAGPSGPVSRARPANALALPIELGGVAIDIHFPASLRDAIVTPFRSLVRGRNQPAAAWLAVERRRSILSLTTSLGEATSCATAELVPTLKAMLIAEVLRSATYEVAFHAAALARGGEAILLVGSPGAGKTTLAVALAHSDWVLLADDVTLLRASGEIRGVTLPFTAKASAWPLLSRYYPQIGDQMSHRRPDGLRVRYLQPPGLPADARHRIRAIVLIDRREAGPARLTSADRLSTLAMLLSEGATRDERLPATAFETLVKALNQASCWRLSYSDFEQAADCLGAARL